VPSANAIAAKQSRTVRIFMASLRLTKPTLHQLTPSA
jgi:hypothetical protein